jgi:hypothetical protein
MGVGQPVVPIVRHTHLIAPSDCIHLQIRDHTDGNGAVGSDVITWSLVLQASATVQLNALRSYLRMFSTRNRGLRPEEFWNLCADDIVIDAIVGDETQYAIIFRASEFLLKVVVFVYVIFTVVYRFAPFLSFPRGLTPGRHGPSRSPGSENESLHWIMQLIPVDLGGSGETGRSKKLENAACCPQPCQTTCIIGIRTCETSTAYQNLHEMGDFRLIIEGLSQKCCCRALVGLRCMCMRLDSTLTKTGDATHLPLHYPRINRRLNSASTRLNFSQLLHPIH